MAGKFVQVTGADKVLRALVKKRNRHRDVEGTVGYGAAYAVYVHEDLNARHPNGGQAKFLEEPARRLGPVMGRIVANLLRQKRALRDAVLAAALYLQAASQALVPVDTGFLKASARTRVAETNRR